MNFNQLYYLHFAILMPRLLVYSNSGVLSSSSSSSYFHEFVSFLSLFVVSRKIGSRNGRIRIVWHLISRNLVAYNYALDGSLNKTSTKYDFHQFFTKTANCNEMKKLAVPNSLRPMQVTAGTLLYFRNVTSIRVLLDIRFFFS